MPQLQLIIPLHPPPQILGRGLLYPECKIIIVITSVMNIALPIIAPGSCRPPGKNMRLMSCNGHGYDCILVPNTLSRIPGHHTPAAPACRITPAPELPERGISFFTGPAGRFAAYRRQHSGADLCGYPLCNRAPTARCEQESQPHTCRKSRESQYFHAGPGKP